MALTRYHAPFAIHPLALALNPYPSPCTPCPYPLQAALSSMLQQGELMRQISAFMPLGV